VILKELLKVIYLWFLNDKSFLVGRNIIDDKHYIEQLYEKNQKALKDSDNYLLRSFLQYKCQMHNISCGKAIALSLISPFLMITFIPYALLCSYFSKTQAFEEKLAIINGGINDDLIPVSLHEQYQLVKCKDNYRFVLDFQGLIWIIRIIDRYLFHPYFIFKLTVKVAQYSYLLSYYCPKAIITTSEYSFCSSALTCFCVDRNVQHFNIMHGEKGFDIRDSFFKFSRCYVWEDYYVGLFEALKADMNQFIVEHSSKQQKLIALGKNLMPLKNTIKFYWASEYNHDELIFISEHLKRIKTMGFNIIIRYHPLHKYVFYKKIYPFFGDFEVEDPKQLSLYNSLLETEYVFGTYTTVLYEGYLMNRKLIISDFNYLYLLEKKFISIRLPHSRLSEFKRGSYV